MGVLKLSGGTEIRVSEVEDECFPPFLDDLSAGELHQRVRERLISEARLMEVNRFKEAAARAADITQYELIEEWDADKRHVRWYFRRREAKV